MNKNIFKIIKDISLIITLTFIFYLMIKFKYMTTKELIKNIIIFIIIIIIFIFSISKLINVIFN